MKKPARVAAPPVVMMASDVPQIDLSSLSRQQLQHLLETSRRAGRTNMADAVAHEMRERRAQPEAPRSWVEVEFGELASEPDLELEPELAFAARPEPQPQPEPEPERQPEPPPVAEAAVAPEPVSPRLDVAPVGPADPYAFSAIRSVPDGSLRVSAPAPGRTGPRPRAPLPRTGARVARPGASRARGVVLGALALGAAAAVAIVAMVPLQKFQVLPAAKPTPAPVAQAALDRPAAPVAQPLPRAAVALTLRGPITSPITSPVAEPPTAAAPVTAAKASAASAPPAPTREFTIPAADLLAAAERANRADMARAHAEGLQGTWISPDFAPARCRWSRTDPTLAVCQTRTRYADSRPWRERTGHYRRGADGAWQVAP